MSLLERVGLGSFFSLLFWAFGCIVALVLALVTSHLADIPLVFWIWVMLSMVMIMASMSISFVASIASLESTCVVKTMMLVVADTCILYHHFIPYIIIWECYMHCYVNVLHVLDDLWDFHTKYLFLVFNI